MAQQIILVCDLCMADDDATVTKDVQTIHFGFGGKAWRSADLCPVHHDTVFAPVQQLWEIARPADQVATQQPPKTAPQSAARAPSWKGTPRIGTQPTPHYRCGWCSAHVTTSSGLLLHAARHLGVTRGLTRWPDVPCALCGEHYAGQAQRHLGDHHRDSGLTSIASLMSWAATHGDPHGAWDALRAAVLDWKEAHPQ